MFRKVWFAGFGRYLKENWSKTEWYSEKKTSSLFVFATTMWSRKLATKSERRNWHLFRHSICNTFTNVFLQHFLKMMSNFVENDGCACFTKILCFASKSFKIVESTPRIDVLFSDNHHFVFWKTAFSNFLKFSISEVAVYRTSKNRAHFSHQKKKCWPNVDQNGTRRVAPYSSAFPSPIIVIIIILMIANRSECWMIIRISY